MPKYKNQKWTIFWGHMDYCLIPKKICFKSLANPSCIDLFLTNSKNSFINCAVISAGISDFHNMIVTVYKTTIVTSKHKQIIYCDYKNFDNQKFKNDLISNV